MREKKKRTRISIHLQISKGEAFTRDGQNISPELMTYQIMDFEEMENPSFKNKIKSLVMQQFTSIEVLKVTDWDGNVININKNVPYYTELIGKYYSEAKGVKSTSKNDELETLKAELAEMKALLKSQVTAKPDNSDDDKDKIVELKETIKAAGLDVPKGRQTVESLEKYLNENS